MVDRHVPLDLTHASTATLAPHAPTARGARVPARTRLLPAKSATGALRGPVSRPTHDLLVPIDVTNATVVIAVQASLREARGPIAVTVLVERAFALIDVRVN